MDRPLLGVLLRPRAAGKTTQSLEWLSKGERVDGYPGWSRVLIVLNYRAWQHTTEMARESGLFVSPRDGSPDDLAHRVYFVEDWRKARVTSQVDVLLDDAEWLLPTMPGRLVGITLTGQPVADNQWLIEGPLQ